MRHALFTEFTTRKKNSAKQKICVNAHLSNGLVHMGVKLQGHLHQGPHIAALGVRDARHVQSVVVVVVQKKKKECKSGQRQIRENASRNNSWNSHRPTVTIQIINGCCNKIYVTCSAAERLVFPPWVSLTHWSAPQRWHPCRPQCGTKHCPRPPPRPHGKSRSSR